MSSILSKETEDQLTSKVIELVELTIKKYEEREENFKRYLRPKDAAIYMGVARQTLNTWVVTKGLAQIKINKAVMYDIKELDRFMIKHQI